MTTTGYTDTFNRTVVSGLGSADSGQTYTINSTASQYNVTPSTATIAIGSAPSKLGYIDLQTSDVDITGQVAISAVPATNQCLVGFCAKLSTTSNYYIGTMMVASTGAVSLRFSKVVAGVITTITTTLVTGLTYVGNTFYNLRFSVVWSQALQTNVLSLKLWAVGATQPGGWMATTTDNSFTQYTAGTGVGLYGRDESSVVGTLTTKYQAFASSSYHLPMPASTDPMCYDPAVAYPKQTALESLADAVDAAMATLDPLTSLAGLFPRVRISATNVTLNTADIFIFPRFSATEFNVGTPTNLALDSASIYLPAGVWLVMYEIRLAEAASDYLSISFNGSNGLDIDMRSNASQTNDDGVGGTGHISQIAISTNPATAARYGVTINANNTATKYTATYMALSAIKISEYFT